MKRLILHVGSDKTGTSHIQRFLARNVDALRSEGWAYPENEETRKEAQGEILSGNGYALFAAAKNGSSHTRRIIASYPRQNVVVSSEALSALDPDQLAMVLDEIGRAGYQPTLIFYVRAPIDYLVSGTIQWVKRNSGIVHPLTAIRRNLGNLRRFRGTNIRARIDAMAAIAGRENLIIREYDGLDQVIEVDFLQALSIQSTSKFAFLEQRTNPSLTEEALTLMIAINSEVKDKELSMIASNALMQAQLNTEGSPVKIPRALLDEAAEEFTQDIAYLRSVYGLAHIRPYTEAIACNSTDEVPTRNYVDLCAATLRQLAQEIKQRRK